MPVLRVKIDGVWQDVAGIPTSGDADTLDGKHADEFAAALDVETLKGLVGNTSVSEQIDVALEKFEPSNGGKSVKVIEIESEDDLNNVDFDSYAVGDVILVVTTQ